MASKEELISRWIEIIPAVFVAEDHIQLSGNWKEKLKQAKLKKISPEERKKIAEDYVRAIAEEIVSKSI